MAADLFSALALRNQNPYFQKLLEEGMNTAPIQSNWQGVSRLAYALLAGAEMKDRDADAERSRKLRSNLPGLEETPVAPAAPTPAAPPAAALPPPPSPSMRRPSPSPVASLTPGMNVVGPDGRPVQPLPDGTYPPDAILLPPDAPPQTGPRPGGPIPSSARVIGDDEAVRLGLYDAPSRALAPPQAPPDTPIQPRPVPTQSITRPGNPVVPAPPGAAPQPQVAQVTPPPPGAPPQRSPVQIDPRMAASIRAMLESKDPAIQKQGMELYKQYAKPREETRPLTDPAERARYGIQPTDTNPYQIDAQGKVAPINPQPFAVNVSQQNESEFNKKAGSLRAERFNEYVKGGDDAKPLIADLNALRDIGSRITTGKTAEITAALGPYAQMLGIPGFEKLSDLEAYNAIVAKLQPRMRVPGSGATSDYEMQQFLKALPSIGKTPDGNAIIANTFDALQQHKIQAAEIASRAMSGELSPAEAEKQIRALPDPMELWRKQKGKLPTAPGTNDGWQDVAPGVRIREKK